MPQLLRIICALALFALAPLAIAGSIVPFDQARFDALEKAGRPVVLDFYASWCPVCRAQKPTIDALAAQPAAADLTVMVVDFDKDKAAVHGFDVEYQSTLIAFRGGREVDRSTGERSAAALGTLFARAEH
jgi:thiol-disulfide isomerase/thioredoxin